MNETNQTPFAGIELSNDIKQAIVNMGYVKATPVQEKTIPIFLTGSDLIVQAPTGTGKTAAFGIPIAQMLNPNERFAQVLILSPTRELALQTTGVLRKLMQYKRDVRIATLYGGEKIERQFSVLRMRPQIIVATPGRLIDHLQRRTLTLNTVKTVVLDEADRMLDMGFQADLNKILQTVSAERQTVLFSATISKDIMHIAENYQKDAKHIIVKQDTLTVKLVKQFYTTVNTGTKKNELMALLNSNENALCLVFTNTKRMADKLCEDLQKNKIRADVLHGDINQQKREREMNAFRSGRLDVLVATDVAARGIDVLDIDMVINYDIPMDSESYVHRIGRTGRANRIGTAYTLIYRHETMKLNTIMRDTKAVIQRLSPALGAAV